MYVCMCMFSHIWLFVTQCTVASQAPLSMGYLKWEYCRGLPIPPPRDIPNPGIGSLFPESPASVQFSSVQSLSYVWLFATSWTAALLTCMFITNSWSLLKLMSIESVMPSNHLTLCHPLFLLPSLFPSITVFSSQLVLHIRWPKYWSFSFSISSSNEYLGLISFTMDWLDLLAVQGTLKSLLQHND